MYKTILLDQTAWDAVIDSAGNIALASPPYAVAQDVASALRLFLGELWFDTTKGVPYLQEILGQLPPVALFAARAEQAALTVPGVVTAQCTITKFENRQVNGQVNFTLEDGTSDSVNF